jgi:hypothetical protein
MKPFFLALIALSLIACEQEDDNDSSPSNGSSNSTNTTSSSSNSNSNTTAGAIRDNLLNDDGWIISLFTEEGKDETQYFTAYTFNFHSNGNVMARSANDSINGSYSVSTDDGKIELSMSFPNQGNFGELTDDWYFITQDQDKILFDDSGDVIEFQRRQK